MGIPWLGTAIFAGFEGIQYVAMMVMGGMTVVKAVLLRLLPIMLHFSTTAIQKKIQETGKPGEEDKKLLIGYAAGVGVHALWNIMAVMTAGKIK